MLRVLLLIVSCPPGFKEKTSLLWGDIEGTFEILGFLLEKGDPICLSSWSTILYKKSLSIFGIFLLKTGEVAFFSNLKVFFSGSKAFSYIFSLFLSSIGLKDNAFSSAINFHIDALSFISFSFAEFL